MTVFALAKQTTSQAKVSCIGLPAVGKTSIINLLQGKTPQLEYRPTIGLDFGQVVLGQYEFNLWDFAGQKNFWSFWPQSLLGTKLCLVVTDSTAINVLRTKTIIDWLSTRNKNAGDDMKIIAIANKQDLSGAMKPKRVENLLQVPTFGCVAIDPQYREHVMNILTNEIKHLKEGRK